MADVFETFRNTCLENYKLNLAHFYKALGLAWLDLLKMGMKQSVKILNYDYNHFHNILRLFDVLPNLTYTTSKTMGDYYL